MPMTTALIAMTAGLPATSATAGHVQVAEVARQVDERGHCGQHGGDDRRDVERSVDGDQAGLVGPRLGDVDADDRGDDADGRDDQREDQPLGAERGAAQDQRGDQGHGVGLEEVCGHAGAVTHVVADIVGDGGGVAGVVLGDALLDLADQVGADVGRLGEDAAADAHEHGEHCRAETEALQHLWRTAGVGQDDDGGTEQAEAGGRQADSAASAEGDLHRLLPPAVTVGRGRDPDIGPGGQPHAEVADRGGERRTEQERDGTADPLAHGLCGQREQQDEDDRDEHAESAELTTEVGGGTFLHGLGDLLHLRGALARGEHTGAKHEGNDQCDDRDNRDPDENCLITAGNFEIRGDLGRHRAPDPCKMHISLDRPTRCGPALVERVARRWSDVTLSTLKHR